MGDTREQCAWHCCKEPPIQGQKYCKKHEDLLNPIIPEFKNCVACGEYHGSINKELKCMRATILNLRKVPLR
jgi:hypothetical protein